MLKFPLCDDATTLLPAQMFVAVPTPYGLEQLGRIICRCERATPASKQELVRRIRMSTFQVHFRIIFNSFSHHLRIACPCRLAGRCLRIAHAPVDEVAQRLDTPEARDDLPASRRLGCQAARSRPLLCQHIGERIPHGCTRDTEKTAIGEIKIQDDKHDARD